MKGLVEIYEEMAATTMRNIRLKIVGSRGYYHSLARLSSEVGADLSLINSEQTQKAALVFLSSDEGMYGDIIDKVFGQFLAKIKESHGVDIFVVGKIGVELMTAIAPNIKYTELKMPKLHDDQNLIKLIEDKIFHYQNVELIFGQFESIARQDASSRTLSSSTIEKASASWGGEIEHRLKFLYEPTVSEIATVFSKQIFGGILEQSLQEGELAKNASRLMHLDQALTNIDKELDTDSSKYKKLKKRITGKKQQLQIAGFRRAKI
jgi:F0F1-type ATP synthase gamma subunit